MFNKLMTILLVFTLQSAFATEGYNAGGDFNLDYALNGNGNSLFSPFATLGSGQVMAGMDFDGDSFSEILFSVYESNASSGSFAGKVGCFLYEADGSGGYNYVWSFITPSADSLPGIFYGDFDADTLSEIYFGVSPLVVQGSVVNSWGTHIFEQNSDKTFPSIPTLVFQYGKTSADNFNPAGYELADLDGDGKVELCTVDPGSGELSIDALATTDLDGSSSFTNEYLDTLDGSAVYNLDVLDLDVDGKLELWVESNLKMVVLEAAQADSYRVAAALDDTNGAYKRNGFGFADADGDGDLDAWFPMSNGKLVYMNNSVNDIDSLTLGTNEVTNSGFENGTSGWAFESEGSSFDLLGTGETLRPMMIDTTVYTDTTATGADTTWTVYDTSATVLFTAFAGDSSLKISGFSNQQPIDPEDPETPIAVANIVNTTVFTPGAQFVISGEFFTSSVDSLNQLGSYGVLFAMYGGGNLDSMDFVPFKNATTDTWHHLEVLCTVPANASIVNVGVMYVQPTDTSLGSFFVDDLKVQAVSESGVNLLAAKHFTEVLTFGAASSGSDIGDIDGDNKMDIIAGTGAGERIVRMEFLGGNPASASSYDVTTILESVGQPADWYNQLDISDNDLDGDGELEVVITNGNASDPTQAMILVLDYGKWKFDTSGDNPDQGLAENWSIAAASYGTDVDTTFYKEGDNSRTVIGGMDMDNDGKEEVIATDYAGHRVVVFEYDAANEVFDAVWTSPVVDTVEMYSNPRTVGVGDLDGDGRQEVIFPSGSKDAPGYHIYEWDGVTGSDQYGTTFSSVCRVEVDTCCAVSNKFRGRHDRITIFDIDSDGKEELCIATRDADTGRPKGTIIVSLSDGDNLVHNSGGGFESWNVEFSTNRSDYGGGSPLHNLPADLNGDGHYELINHTWNAFHFYNITSTDTNAYRAPVVGDPTGWYKATTGFGDQYSIFGGNTHDIDDDGNDEAYFASYGNWGRGTGDVYVVDYDSTDSVLVVNGDHVVRIAKNIGQFIGDVGWGYDGNDDRKSLFVGRTVPNITALDYIGPDPRSSSSYLKKVIWTGEHDVVHTTITIDSTDAPDSVYASSPWGFASKIETNWDGELLDFDNDNKAELLVSFQSIEDSLKTTTKTLNMDSLANGVTHYDVVVTKVQNHKDYTFVILENGTPTDLLSSDPIRFVLPNDYRLDQNYPNPFNPNTTIQYTVPIDRKVSIKVYNITGQLVRTLVNNELAIAGTHRIVWNGKNNFGRTVSTGIYLYSLEWAGMRKVKRMTLVK